MKKRLLLIFLITVISSLALPLTAMAEVKEETGITVERSVNVISGKDIEVTLTASAKASYDLSNVMLVNQTPKGYRVASGDTLLTIDEIKSGDTKTLTTVFTKDVNTGDNNGSKLMLYGVVAVLSMLLALIILRNTKRINKALMLILCFSLIGTGALAVSGTAFATSNSEIKLSKEVTVRNEQVTVDSLVNYGRVSENTGILTYDANGHGTAPEAVTMKYAVETKAANALSETGYTFEEWNTSADGKGTSYAAGSVVKAADETARDTKLYAIWKEKTAVLTYVDSGVTTTEDMKYSEATTLKTPTKEGYDFQGWTTKEDGTGVSYQANAVIKEANVEPAAITLYAQWKELLPKAILTSDGKTMRFVYDSKDYKEGENYKVSDTSYETITAVYYVPKDLSQTAELADMPWKDKVANVTKASIEDSYADYQPTSIASMFSGMTNLATIDGLNKNLDTSRTTSIFRAFNGVGSNVSTNVYLDVSNLDTSKVTEMRGVFNDTGRYTAQSVTIEGLDDWDTSSSTTMRIMFQCTGEKASTVDIGDLSNWNTSKVTSTAYMFYGTGSCASTFDIGDLSDWDTSNVTDMSVMFYYTGNKASNFDLGDLGNWDTSKVTNMSWMFEYAGSSATNFYIGDLSDWNTSNVTNMYSLFYYAGSSASTFDIGDLDNWDTSNATNLSGMFAYAGQSASTYNIGDLSNWDISKATNIAGMLCAVGRKANNYTVGDLSNWDTSSVTDMSYLFEFMGQNTSAAFNVGDLSKWNTSNVTTMSYMFDRTAVSATTKTNPNISGWDVNKVTSHTDFNYSASWVTPPTWVS